MRDLPMNPFFEGFYIWFDKEKKEEYYATPSYLHNVEKDIDLKTKKQKLVYKKCKFDGLKYPALIDFPYVENFGTMLMRFLNADFSNFEKAYKTFFFAYGFELLREYIPYKELETSYTSEKKMLDIMKKVFEVSSHELYEIQENFKKCINQIYNLDGKNELENYSANSKFIANIIKRESEVYRYSNKIEVFLDNYSNKCHEYDNKSYTELVEKIENNQISINKYNIYTSEKLSNILYLILEQIVQVPNLPIKKCQNCNKYFIPSSRQDEVYCDFEDDEGKSCKVKGAVQTYKKLLENNPALLEYRRSYQKKIMFVARNKGNKKLKDDFDNWKKEAQVRIKLFKQGELKEETLYKWIMDHK